METGVPPPPFACRGRGFSRSLGAGRTKKDGCRHPSFFTHRDFADFRFRDSAKSVLRDFSLPLPFFAMRHDTIPVVSISSLLDAPRINSSPFHVSSEQRSSALLRVQSCPRYALPLRQVPPSQITAIQSAQFYSTASLVLPKVPTVILKSRKPFAQSSGSA